MNLEEITDDVLKRIGDVKAQLTMQYSNNRFKQQRNIELRRKRTIEKSREWLEEYGRPQ
jgi:hypothetical protein